MGMKEITREKEREAAIRETLDLFWRSMPPIWHATRTITHTIATEEFAMTPSKFHALRRIVEGRQYVSQLADCMHLSRPNISRLVDELVTDGLIERQPDPHDRRNVRLQMTEKGQNLFSAMHARVHAQMAAFFSILSEEELTDVKRGLAAMQKLVNK
jgi:DNA-binding MarR family transcriptional regulator